MANPDPRVRLVRAIETELSDEIAERWPWFGFQKDGAVICYDSVQSDSNPWTSLHCAREPGHSGAHVSYVRVPEDRVTRNGYANKQVAGYWVNP